MTTKTEILKVIRAKCMDCSGEIRAEVEFCPVQACELWPFRFGKDPNPAKKGFAVKARVQAQQNGGVDV